LSIFCSRGTPPREVPKVDGFVPRTQDVNLRIVRRPDVGRERLAIQEQSLYRNVQWFRGGLVFRAIYIYREREREKERKRERERERETHREREIPIHNHKP